MKKSSQTILFLFFILSLLVIASCQSKNQQQTPPQVSSKTTSFLNDVLPNNNASQIVEYMNNSIDFELLSNELINIQWQSVPPKSFTDFQSASSGNMSVTLNGDFARMIKLLGEQYDAGEINQVVYTNSMTVLDATLIGILNAHKQLNDRSIDQSGAILTYAGLARSFISQQLIDRNFDQYTSLSNEQRKTLRDITRTQSYEKLDTFPGILELP
jgi:hypothetical protein